MAGTDRPVGLKQHESIKSQESGKGALFEMGLMFGFVCRLVWLVGLLFGLVVVVVVFFSLVWFVDWFS